MVVRVFMYLLSVLTQKYCANYEISLTAGFNFMRVLCNLVTYNTINLTQLLVHVLTWYNMCTASQ